MRPIVTNRLAWSACLTCLSVCHSSEPCKNGWTDRDAVWVEDSGGPREPCIRWGLDLPWEGAIFRGKDVTGHARRVGNDTAVSCAKVADLIEMSFGLLTPVSQRKHVLGAVHTGTAWRIPLSRPCAAAMRPFCQITWPICFLFIWAKLPLAVNLMMATMLKIWRLILNFQKVSLLKQ